MVTESSLIADPASESFQHPKSGITMIRIPSGTFLMGGKIGDERPRRFVVIPRPFYLGKYPVSVREYLRMPKSEIMVNRKRGMQSGLKTDRPMDADQDAEYPMAGISWQGAREYCLWAGLRLPSEAEWEYACCAGSRASYCFGDSEESLIHYGWYSKNAGGRIRPVGRLWPNAWGLHDMHGNVWEWCEDDYWPTYGCTPVDGSACRNGQAEERRVIRGGAWFVEAYYCRSRTRMFAEASGEWESVGFRGAASIP